MTSLERLLKIYDIILEKAQARIIADKKTQGA